LSADRFCPPIGFPADTFCPDRFWTGCCRFSRLVLSVNRCE
jgi:hypothetical protein